MSAEAVDGSRGDEPRRSGVRLTPLRAVPAPSTTPFPAPTRRTGPRTVPVPTAPIPTPTPPASTTPARPEPARVRPAPVPRAPVHEGPVHGAPDAPGPVPHTAPFRAVPDTPGARAAHVVRETWAEMEPQVDEVAGWFAALLFTLDPGIRALFPTTVTPPARRLLRSMLLPMTTLDRPADLAAALDPLVAEHRGLGLAAEQYETIGVALVGAMRRFAGDRWDSATERAWAQAFALVAEPLEELLAAETAPAVVTASVVGHRRLSWDLAVVTVRPDAPVTYRAGQSVSVEVPARPRMWRALTPASAPRADGTLEFHVRAVEGGWVSRAMVAHTGVGDRWRIGPARGRLEVDPAGGRDVLMVAGGTGAAPMLALCEELAGCAGPPAVTVLVGGRTPDDLYALERFEALAATHPWLVVAGVCEDDPLATETIPGTLPDAVVRAGDWSEHDVLLAGSPAMIRATASALMVDGVALDRIRYDPFTE